MLTAFFPADATTLTAQAEEAAISGLYGGIQWPSDIEVGQVVGRQIGLLAIERAQADGDLR